MANGETNVGVLVRLPSEVSGECAVMKGAVGKAVLGVEAHEIREIIELVKNASQRSVLVQRVEIAAVDGVGQLGNRGRAPAGRDLDDAPQGVGSIQNAVRPETPPPDSLHWLQGWRTRTLPQCRWQGYRRSAPY